MGKRGRSEKPEKLEKKLEAEILREKILDFINKAEEYVSFDDIAQQVGVDTKYLIDFLFANPEIYQEVMNVLERLKIILSSRIEKRLFQIAQGKCEDTIQKTDLIAIEMVLKKYATTSKLFSELEEWEI